MNDLFCSSRQCSGDYRLSFKGDEGIENILSVFRDCLHSTSRTLLCLTVAAYQGQFGAGVRVGDPARDYRGYRVSFCLYFFCSYVKLLVLIRISTLPRPTLFRWYTLRQLSLSSLIAKSTVYNRSTWTLSCCRGCWGESKRVCSASSPSMKSFFSEQNLQSDTSLSSLIWRSIIECDCRHSLMLERRSASRLSNSCSRREACASMTASNSFFLRSSWSARVLNSAAIRRWTSPKSSMVSDLLIASFSWYSEYRSILAPSLIRNSLREVSTRTQLRCRFFTSWLRCLPMATHLAQQSMSLQSKQQKRRSSRCSGHWRDCSSKVSSCGGLSAGDSILSALLEWRWECSTFEVPPDCSSINKIKSYHHMNLPPCPNGLNKNTYMSPTLSSTRRRMVGYILSSVPQVSLQ